MLALCPTPVGTPFHAATGPDDEKSLIGEGLTRDSWWCAA
jgi:hypothetical protein